MAFYLQSFDTAVDTSDDIVLYIMSSLSNNGLPKEKCVKIQLAIEEAIVNICSYAYIHNFPITSGEVIVEINIDDNVYDIKLKDKGIAYNPLQYSDPAIWAPAESKDVGGLGIYLIKQMMDEVDYENDGDYNILKLKIIKN